MTTAISRFPAKNIFAKTVLLHQRRIPRYTGWNAVRWAENDFWLAFRFPMRCLAKKLSASSRAPFVWPSQKMFRFPSPRLLWWWVGRSKKKKKRMNTWRGLGSRQGRAAKEESLVTKCPCLVLYGVFPGLLGQCILVTYPRRMAGLWRLAWTKWPETHRLRAIMRARD